VQVERVESSIPIVYCQLDVLHMLVGKCVGLSTIYLREEGVVSHCQSREDRRCDGFSEGATEVIRST
jgi:hypothetical protein